MRYLNLKKMKKNNALATLEAAIVSEKTIMVVKPARPGFLYAVRIAAHKRNETTHFVSLNIDTNLLQWANNKRSQWEHQFADKQQADDWWRRMIVARVKQAA